MICEYLQYSYSQRFESHGYYCEFPDPKSPGMVIWFWRSPREYCWDHPENCPYRKGDISQDNQEIDMEFG